MVQNKQIRNFLFLLSGIVLLFCGSIPNFAESVIALLRGLLSFINLGWIGTLLIISRVLLILGGTALSVIGAIFMIQDATAAKRQPNWVVLGCTGGGVFFGLLSLVPLLFWIGIFGVAALVVAMVFAYKDVVGAWRNPVSKIASFMMIGSLVAFFDRFYNIPMGLMETHWLAGLCGIAAFIYLCVWKGNSPFILTRLAAAVCSCSSWAPFSMPWPRCSTSSRLSTSWDGLSPLQHGWLF